MIAFWLFNFASVVLPIEDVKVGDEDGRGRVVVACAGPCDVAPIGPQTFLIKGASARFTTSTSDVSDVIDALSFAPAPEGVSMAVATVRPASAVNVARCGYRRLCFDFDLAPPNAPLRPEPVYSAAGVADAGFAALLRRARLVKADSRLGVPGSPGPISCRAAQSALRDNAWDLSAFRTLKRCGAVPPASLAQALPGEDVEASLAEEPIPLRRRIAVIASGILAALR